jgi:hypothetical protein
MSIYIIAGYLIKKISSKALIKKFQANAMPFDIGLRFLLKAFEGEMAP